MWDDVKGGDAPPDPAEGQVADSRLADEDFVYWLEGAGFYDTGTHTPFIDGREPSELPLTAKAVALLWDVYQGALRTASAMEAEAQARAERDRARIATEAAKAAARVAAEAEEAERRRRYAEQQQEKRKALVARLADPAWVLGEDDEALRSVAAWVLDNLDTMELKAHDRAQRDAINAHLETLQREVAARDEEIAAAEAEQERTKFQRLARGEPPLAVPAPLAPDCDYDAVARWLVAHGFGLALGQRTTYTYEDDAGEQRTQSRVENIPSSWSNVQDACARRSTWKEVADAAHGDEAVLAYALTALLPADEQSQEVREAVWRHRQAWAAGRFAPRDTNAQTGRPRTEGRARRASALLEEELRPKVLAAVRAYKRQYGRWPSKNAIAENVPGRRARVIAVIEALVMEEALNAPSDDHPEGYWFDE